MPWIQFQLCNSQHCPYLGFNTSKDSGTWSSLLHPTTSDWPKKAAVPRVTKHTCKPCSLLCPIQVTCNLKCQIRHLSDPPNPAQSQESQVPVFSSISSALHWSIWSKRLGAKTFLTVLVYSWSNKRTLILTSGRTTTFKKQTKSHQANPKPPSGGESAIDWVTHVQCAPNSTESCTTDLSLCSSLPAHPATFTPKLARSSFTALWRFKSENCKQG